jgi:hypothetical protein
MGVNVISDHAHWNNFLLGTWNSTDGKYEASSVINTVYGCTTTGSDSVYGGSINAGDYVSFNVTCLSAPVSSSNDLSLWVNGTPVADFDLNSPGSFNYSQYVHPGDSVFFRLCTGCCLYDYEFQITPIAIAGNFWTNYAGCHET